MDPSRRTSLKRKPFSDLTNTPSHSTSSALSLLKSKSKSKSKPKPESKSSDPKPSLSSNIGEIPISSIGSSDPENHEDRRISCSTPKAKEISWHTGGDADNIDKLDVSTVYTRRVVTRRKGKEKVIAAAPTLSCPPMRRIRSIEGNMWLKDDNADLRGAFSVPCHKARKRHTMPQEVQKPILPRDFVEKQSAYFAEVDAFELPEEEVSESELE